MANIYIAPKARKMTTVSRLVVYLAAQGLKDRMQLKGRTACASIPKGQSVCVNNEWDILTLWPWSKQRSWTQIYTYKHIHNSKCTCQMHDMCIFSTENFMRVFHWGCLWANGIAFYFLFCDSREHIHMNYPERTECVCACVYVFKCAV